MEMIEHARDKKTLGGNSRLVGGKRGQGTAWLQGKAGGGSMGDGGDCGKEAWETGAWSRDTFSRVTESTLPSTLTGLHSRG